MPNDDFNAGLSGGPAGPNSDPIAFNHGRTVRENMEMAAQANQQPKSKHSLVPDQKIEVSGAGVGFLIFAPLFYIFYPIGGIVNLAAAGAALAGVEYFTDVKGFQWLGGAGAAILMIVPAYLLERWVSRFPPYRWVRHILRVILMGVIVFAAIHAGAPKTGGIYTPEYQIPYVAIFWGVVTAGAAHYITRTLDLMLGLRPESKKEIRKWEVAQSAQPSWTEGSPRQSKRISNLWIFGGVIYLMALILFSKQINPIYGILAAVVFVIIKIKRNKRKRS